MDNLLQLLNNIALGVDDDIKKSSLKQLGNGLYVAVLTKENATNLRFWETRLAALCDVAESSDLIEWEELTSATKVHIRKIKMAARLNDVRSDFTDNMANANWVNMLAILKALNTVDLGETMAAFFCNAVHYYAKELDKEINPAVIAVTLLQSFWNVNPSYANRLREETLRYVSAQVKSGNLNFADLYALQDYTFNIEGESTTISDSELEKKALTYINSIKKGTL